MSLPKEPVIVSKSIIYKHKEKILIFFLYYYIFLSLFKYFTSWHWDTGTVVPRDVVTIWEGAKAPGLLRRGSRSLLSWVSSTEGEKSHWDQSTGGGWKEKVYREEEEEEEAKVFEETSEWGFGQGYWESPGYEN